MKINALAAPFGWLLAGAAFAQGPMDTNGDGAVSLEEFQAARAQVAAERFAKLDVDGDGLLTPEELRAGFERRGHRPVPYGERFDAIDTDGDGAWSFAELRAVRPNLDVEQFNRLDRNGDGLISEDERPLRHGR